MAGAFLPAALVQSTQSIGEGLLMDECVIITRTEDTGGGYGQYTVTESESESTPCKVQMGGSTGRVGETQDAEEVAQADGSILFSVEMAGTIGRHDRIRITKVAHVELDRPITVDVQGEPFAGLLGLKVFFKLITGGVADEEEEEEEDE